MIEPANSLISVHRQCSLINLSESSYYYHPVGFTDEELELMRKIDRIYTAYPFYGVRRITDVLRREGWVCNHKRIWRLMGIMGIQAIYPKKKLSQPNKEHIIYPYLLKGIKVRLNNQVWSSDITYLPLYGSFVYLVAIIDWFSRFILSWEISNRLDVHFCLSALDKALRKGKPQIFNTDQGSQFTSVNFVQKIIDNKIQMSMDSRGRALDNIFIERFWRSLKYEDIYIKDYQNVNEIRKGLKNYFKFYNFRRPHQGLKYMTPAEVYLNNVC